MRIAVGLLACLGAGALSSSFADPSTETAPAATAAPAAPAASTPASPANSATTSQVTISAKAELDRDTAHFVAEGYKPEMHNGEQIYCRRETALGSRLSPVKNCGTIEQLKLTEDRAKAGVSASQRQQTGTSIH